MFQRLTASLTPTSFLPSALLGITGTKESKYATSDATDDEFASDTMSQFEMPKVGGAGRLTPAPISNGPPRSPRTYPIWGFFSDSAPPASRDGSIFVILTDASHHKRATFAVKDQDA